MLVRLHDLLSFSGGPLIPIARERAARHGGSAQVAAVRRRDMGSYTVEQKGRSQRYGDQRGALCRLHSVHLRPALDQAEVTRAS
jgi:hypothetical protein